MNLPCYARYADRHIYGSIIFGVQYFRGRLREPSSLGVDFTLKPSKFAFPINDWVYYDHENNVNVIIICHN